MSSTSSAAPDVINAILGVDDSSPIAALRNRKPVLVTEVQAYYESIFQPTPASEAVLPLASRFVAAVRVASHTGSSDVVDWYANLATSSGTDQAIIDRAKDVSASWTGQTPLDAAIRHADLLTTGPVDAEEAHLHSLKEAGFTPAGIVSLSQTIAFVTYQLRLVAGLRAIAGLE